MDFKCKACGAALGDGDIDPERFAARCTFCGALFSLSGRRLAGSGRGKGGDRGERPEAPLPDRFRFRGEGGRLEIRWRWISRGWAVLACIGLANAAIGGLQLAGVMEFRTDRGGSLPAGIQALLLLIGLAFLYAGVAGLLNRTTVTLADGNLEIRHGPIPWPGGGRYALAGIAQLFSIRKMGQNHRGVAYDYCLVAVRRDGGRTRLVKGLRTVGEALYLEQRIEGALGIRDRPIVGEIER